MTQPDLTTREAGRLGGRAVAAKYGSEHFSEIGKKGGQVVLEQRGQDFFETIGKKAAIKCVTLTTPPFIP